MQNFSLIGYPIEHSFSAAFFNHLFEEQHIDACYTPCPAPDEKTLREILLNCSISGYNITHPWKIAVIRYLDEIDIVAERIGSVNVVARENGILKGYNTDAEGFRLSLVDMLVSAKVGISSIKALVLGTGGVAKAVMYALENMNIEALTVSRTNHGDLPYDSLTEDIVRQHRLIVNCTPCGMYPDVISCPPMPMQYITSGHLVFDTIYNPETTTFLRLARSRGATTLNGLKMLQNQALRSWQIWKKLINKP